MAFWAKWDFFIFHIFPLLIIFILHFFPQILVLFLIIFISLNMHIHDITIQDHAKIMATNKAIPIKANISNT